MASAMRSDNSSLQSFLLSLWYPQFKTFRNLPQFMVLADRVGLLAFWHEQGPPDGCILVESPEMRLVCGE